MADWTTDQSEAQSTDGKEYCHYVDNLESALNHFEGGKRLHTERNKRCYYGFCWWLPKTVGNAIQGDTVSFDLKFYAEQKRHNKHPDKPWKSADETDAPAE